MENDDDGAFCNSHLKRNRIMYWLLWWSLMLAHIGLLEVVVCLSWSNCSG